MLIEFLLRIVILIALAVFVVYASREARHIQITYREILTPRLPESFDGLTIMHLSDFHLRRTPEFGRSIEKAVSGVKADIVLITGDVSYSRKGLPSFERIAATLQRCLPQARIFACTGNGEIIYRKTGEKTQAAIEQAGGKMLRNENIHIDRGKERIFVVGVDDPFTKRDDLDSALDGVPDDAFKILLAHSPTIATKAAAAGIDIIFSGHTHGGQVRFPVVGAIYARTGFKRAISADYENERLTRAIGRTVQEIGDTKIYVSRGLGTSHLPLRFLCPPEIAVITLRRKIATIKETTLEHPAICGKNK